jgi:hypothetical protein
VRPSPGTPTQNKVVVVLRERERDPTAEYMEARYFRLIKSLHAFTPYRDDSTTANINTTKHVITFTGEQVSVFETFLLTSTSGCKNASLFELLKCDLVSPIYQASGFRTLLWKVFCRGAENEHLLSTSLLQQRFPTRVPQNVFSGSARNRRQ